MPTFGENPLSSHGQEFPLSQTAFDERQERDFQSHPAVNL